MNQARTTYQNDFTPLAWLQNNFSTELDEFCSSENIDECLKYISQEFCALGYPSIYCKTSENPIVINCDIVKLLNATYELLRSCSEHIQVKENLECRNQCLSSDLNALSKKNSQLKNALEQSERKLAGALERERQLKEKNEQMSNLLKNEKDETKKLTAQLRQQKVAFQHDVRKYENNLNHIKAKLNQLLSDKTPNKKIVSMASSQNLPRGTGQRGKWKTSGSCSSPLADEMYNSVISNYESRNKDLYKEISALRHCLSSVLSQILKIISLEQDYSDVKLTISEEFLVNSIKFDSDDLQSIENKFKCIFPILEKITSEKENSIKLEQTVTLLKAKLVEYENVLKSQAQEDNTSVDELSNEKNQINSTKIIMKDLQEQKLNLDKEKASLSEAHQNIEKEKADLAAEKLALLRFSMQQKSFSKWHQGLDVSPSISVITYNDGKTIYPTNQLKMNASSPDQVFQSSPPIVETHKEIVNIELHSKSSPSLGTEESINPSSSFSSQPAKSCNSDLPSWATKQGIIIEDTEPVTPRARYSTSSELLSESSSEELNLLRFKAAMQELEQRRTKSS